MTALGVNVVAGPAVSNHANLRARDSRKHVHQVRAATNAAVCPNPPSPTSSCKPECRGNTGLVLTCTFSGRLLLATSYYTSHTSLPIIPSRWIEGLSVCLHRDVRNQGLQIISSPAVVLLEKELHRPECFLVSHTIGSRPWSEIDAAIGYLASVSDLDPYLSPVRQILPEHAYRPARTPGSHEILGSHRIS